MVGEEDIITVPQAGDDVADITHDGCKHQHGNEQIGNHEEVLFFPVWERRVTHSGEDLGGEPEAVEVLAPHGGKHWVGDVGVDPAVSSEPDVVGQGKVEAGVPVDQHKDVEHELGDAEGVGVGGACLHAIHGLIEAWRAKEAVDPHQRSVDAHGKVQEVCGQHRAQIP